MKDETITPVTLDVFPSTVEELSELSSFSRPFLNTVRNRRISGYQDIELRSAKTQKIRHISQPDAGVRSLQRWILTTYLSDSQIAHRHAFAYVPGRSPLEAAQEHLDSSWIIRMDISDFFHSIDEKMIYFASRRMGMEKSAAFLLSRLVTRASTAQMTWLPEKYRQKSGAQGAQGLGFLPQGSPTSGQISNLVARRLDQQLEEFAHIHALRISRYSDDIFISRSSHRDSNSLTSIQPRDVIFSTEHLLQNEGFRPNQTKTKIMWKGNRQVILGLSVDSNQLRITREKKNNLTFHFYAIAKFGWESHAQSLGYDDPEFVKNYLRGYLTYLSDVNQADADSYWETFRRLS